MTQDNGQKLSLLGH